MTDAEETKESVILQTIQPINDNETNNTAINEPVTLSTKALSSISNNDIKEILLPKPIVKKFRFADFSQLQESKFTNAKPIMKKLEKEAITQIIHGKCNTSNFVMDFQMDIGTVYQPNVRFVNGPLSGKLSVSQRKTIKNIILKIWMNSKYTSNILCCHKCKYICYLLLLFTVIGVPMIFLYTLKDFNWFIGLAVGFICLGITICVIWLYVLRQNGYEFRAEFLSQIKKYMNTKLKEQYPNLLFTLIYPVKMEGSVNYLISIRSNIWCYLRVSDGLIDLDDFEPLIHRTCDVNDEILPEYNEHCGLFAISKGFGDPFNVNNVGKSASHAGDAMNVVKSMTNIISNRF